VVCGIIFDFYSQALLSFVRHVLGALLSATMLHNETLWHTKNKSSFMWQVEFLFSIVVPVHFIDQNY